MQRNNQPQRKNQAHRDHHARGTVLIQRSIPITVPMDLAVRATLHETVRAFQIVQQAVSVVAFEHLKSSADADPRNACTNGDPRNASLGAELPETPRRGEILNEEGDDRNEEGDDRNEEGSGRNEEGSDQPRADQHAEPQSSAVPRSPAIPSFPASPTLREPLSAFKLQQACYNTVRGRVSSQMTITAIRLVAGAYRSAWRKGHLPRQSFAFRQPLAVWLIGPRKKGRDASVPEDGILSLWTVGGRKRLPFQVPPRFQEQLRRAVCIDSVTFRAEVGSIDALSTGNIDALNSGSIDASGESQSSGESENFGREQDAEWPLSAGEWSPDDIRSIDDTRPAESCSSEEGGMGIEEESPARSLRAWLTVTVEAPEPAGQSPIGIDRGAVNALVAVDAEDRLLFISGQEHQARNDRTRKTRQQVSQKRAERKAQKKDTRSVRRLTQRLNQKQSNRTRTFCQQAALALCRWAPAGAAFVFENLHLPASLPSHREQSRGRLPAWFHGLLRRCIENKAQEQGIPVITVPAAFTSQDCSQCGARGRRQRSRFTCPACGHTDHADVNAARNIRDAGAERITAPATQITAPATWTDTMTENADNGVAPHDGL